MRRLTEEECIQRLMSAMIGSHVRVRYIPGRPPSARALLESQVANDRGLDIHVFVGSLEAVAINRRGRFYFTLHTVDRNTIDADGNELRGAPRSFNPSLGVLLALRVIR